MKLRVQFFKHESLGFISIVYIAKQNKKQKVFGFSKRNRGFSKFNGIRVFVKGNFLCPPQNLGPIGSTVLTFIAETNKQTNNQTSKVKLKERV